MQWKSNYRIGQVVVCKVVSRSPVGYNVTIVRENQPAVLESTDPLNLGQEVLGRIYNLDRRQIILHPEVSGESNRRSGQLGGSPRSTIHGAQSTQQQNYQSQTNSYQNIQSNTYQNIQANTYQNIQTNSHQNLPANTQQNIQSPPQSNSYQNMPAYGQPQQTHGQIIQPSHYLPGPTATPQGQHMPTVHYMPGSQLTLQLPKARRFIDLIPHPISFTQAEKIDMREWDAEQLLQWLEGGMRTACIKGFCENKLSRFVILSLGGRLVGCTYGRKDLPTATALPVNEAIRLIVDDLNQPNSVLYLGDVPAPMMKALAALYMGQPLDIPYSDPGVALGALEKLFTQKQLTGSIVVCSPQGDTRCFVYVSQGRPVGYFDVLNQKLDGNLEQLFKLISQEPNLILRASILPDATQRLLGTSFSFLARKNGQQMGGW